jgi:hypothetical protein
MIHDTPDCAVTDEQRFPRYDGHNQWWSGWPDGSCIDNLDTGELGYGSHGP